MVHAVIVLDASKGEVYAVLAFDALAEAQTYVHSVGGAETEMAGYYTGSTYQYIVKPIVDMRKTEG